MAALVIGGAEFAPGLLLRWYDGSGRASGPSPESTAQAVDVAWKHFAFAWPARGEERPAPGLLLRVPPTDWYALWSWQSGSRVRKLPSDGPGGLGYQRNLVHTSCTDHDVCETQFLFAQRLVRLDFVNLLPSRDRELTRLRLLLSTWEMLNRQRADAAIAPQAIAALAEARAQLSRCGSAAAAFMRLGEQQHREMTDSRCHNGCTTCRSSLSRRPTSPSG